MRKGIAIFLCLFAVAAFAQKDKKLVEKTVERSSIQAHLKFLASDFMKSDSWILTRQMGGFEAVQGTAGKQLCKVWQVTLYT